jgi:Cu-Zn family superoxide dismutase
MTRSLSIPRNFTASLLFGLVMLSVLIMALPAAASDEPARALAMLQPTAGNTATGLVTFTKAADGVRVVAEVEGLSPGNHGFHIHAFGDCSSGDGTSAGGHFNPTSAAHGAPTAAAGHRHTGDLGNITAGADGKAHLEYTDPLLAFAGEQSILGRGVIVHADKDDFTTQPTGAAGARVACGVIGVSANPE